MELHRRARERGERGRHRPRISERPGDLEPREGDRVLRRSGAGLERHRQSAGAGDARSGQARALPSARPREPAAHGTHLRDRPADCGSRARRRRDAQQLV